MVGSSKGTCRHSWTGENAELGWNLWWVGSPEGSLWAVLHPDPSQSCLYSCPTTRKKKKKNLWKKKKNCFAWGKLGTSSDRTGKRSQQFTAAAFDLLNNSCQAKEHLGHIFEGISGESWSWGSPWTAQRIRKHLQRSRVRNPFCSGHVTLGNLSASISLDDLGKSLCLFVYSCFSFLSFIVFFPEKQLTGKTRNKNCIVRQKHTHVMNCKLLDPSWVSILLFKRGLLCRSW